MKRNKCRFINILLLIYTFLNYDSVSCQNATDCVNMYFNKTIETPCVINSSCCYVQYSNLNATFKKCLLKKNATEDLCDNISSTVSYVFGSVDICDCIGSYLSRVLSCIILVMLIF